MNLKDLNTVLNQLAASGQVSPPQLDPTPQSGVFNLEQFNKDVSDLSTDLGSVINLFAKQEQSVVKYKNSVIELEGWATNRQSEIASRRTLQGGTAVKWETTPCLALETAIPVVPIAKYAMPYKSKKVAEKGPWQQVAAWDGTLSIGARWRFDFGKEVTISEVSLPININSFGFYKVVKARVVSTSPIVLDTQLPIGQEVVFDIVSGVNKDSWGVGTVSGSVLSGCDFDVAVGDDITLSIAADATSIDNGVYEVEILDKPVLGQYFDITVTEEGSVAWVGLPDPQFSLKVYAPRTKVYSKSEIEPGDWFILNDDGTVLPSGSAVTYEVVGDSNPSAARKRFQPNSLSGLSESTAAYTADSDNNSVARSIQTGTLYDTRAVFNLTNVTETLYQDRFLKASTTWKPIEPIETVLDDGSAFNPNMGKTKDFKFVFEDWAENSEAKIKGDTWVTAACSLNTACSSIRLLYTESLPRNPELISAVTSSTCGSIAPSSGAGIYLNNGFLSNDANDYYTALRVLGNPTGWATPATSWSLMYEKTAAYHIDFKSNEIGETYSLRWLPTYNGTTAATVQFALYKESAILDGINTTSTLATTSHLVADGLFPSSEGNDGQLRWMSFDINCSLTLATQGLINVSIYKLPTNDTAATFIAGLTDVVDEAGLLSGCGFSIYGGAFAIGPVAIYGNVEDNTVTRVVGYKDKLVVQPDLSGFKSGSVQPKRISNIVTRQPDGAYNLPTVPVNTTGSNSTLDIQVYKVDLEGGIGDLVYDGMRGSNSVSISISGTTMRLLGTAIDGPVLVRFWGVPGVTGSIPFSSNKTDYTGLASVKALRPFDNNYQSDTYHPVLEYVQRGHDLIFASQLDRLDVSYKSFATFLKVRATFTRGANPCRSPRVSARWELID